MNNHYPLTCTYTQSNKAHVIMYTLTLCLIYNKSLRKRDDIMQTMN